MKFIWISVALLPTMVGCSPTKLATDANREATRTEYRERLQTDSVHVYLRDSIHVRERGDTVFVNVYKTHVAYRERLRIDTISLTDTVTTTLRETIVEETNRLTGWQYFQIWTGRIAAALIVVYMALKRFLK